MKYVENQCLQGVCWNKPVVSTKNATFIIAPRLNQYNASFEQEVILYQTINLRIANISSKKYEINKYEEFKDGSVYNYNKRKPPLENTGYTILQAG